MRAATAFALMGLIAYFAAEGMAAPIPAHLMKKADDDLAKLQGKWKLESLRLGARTCLSR